MRLSVIAYICAANLLESGSNWRIFSANTDYAYESIARILGQGSISIKKIAI